MNVRRGKVAPNRHNISNHTLRQSFKAWFQKRKMNKSRYHWLLNIDAFKKWSMASYSFCLMLFAVISVQLSTGQTKNFFTEGWDHNNQDEWHKEYPDCGGSYQSPIDLQDICSQDTTTIVQDDLYLTFWNYHRPILRSFLTLTNNGHTAQVDLRGSHKINYWAPRISGSAVNNHVYQFVQLHFHWDPVT